MRNLQVVPDVEKSEEGRKTLKAILDLPGLSFKDGNVRIESPRKSVDVSLYCLRVSVDPIDIMIANYVRLSDEITNEISEKIKTLRKLRGDFE